MPKFDPKFKIPDTATVNPYGIDYEGFLTWKNKKNGFMVAACHYTADPEKRSEEWFREATRLFRPDQIDREFEINFESRAGQRVFGYLLDDPSRWRIANIDLHDLLKTNWRIIASLDYGTQSPTAIHFFAIDDHRRFYSVFEFYKPSNVREIALVLKGIHPDYRHPLWRRCERVVVDGSIFKKDQDDGQEGHQSIGDLIEEQGIYIMERATKDRLAGLERVRDALTPSASDGLPSLYFCERCENQWKEFTNLVYDELPPHLLLNKNQKEDVIAKKDHCFVAGTMIETIGGPVPIEKIKKGDLVLTRGGYRPVLDGGPTEVAQTYELVFDNGARLTCTANHPIWTENRGWTRADELRHEDICVTNLPRAKKSLLTRLVGFAGSLFVKADTLKQGPVAVYAARLLERCPAEIAQVYNLSVGDRHEYFANWVLASNSYDSTRYALMSIQAPSNTPPEPKPGGGTLGAVEKEMDLDEDEEEANI